MHSGFTLIELLVVMAIIALLSGFLIAGIGGSQKLAEDKAAFAQLTVINEGLRQYRVEYGFYPPASNKDNNLAYALNHPDPKMPKTRADRDHAKNQAGYPNDYLWGKIGEHHFDYSEINWETLTAAMTVTTPIPLYDGYPQEGSTTGTAYLYAYNNFGRQLFTGSNSSYDVRDFARKGFTSEFDLWSCGTDGVASANYHLHNLELPENIDNLTATVYK